MGEVLNVVVAVAVIVFFVRWAASGMSCRQLASRSRSTGAPYFTQAKTKPDPILRQRCSGSDREMLQEMRYVPTPCSRTATQTSVYR